jgi:hypothetical protein
MAGAGYLVFTAGQVLTAAQVNTYLNQQTTMVFASASVRDSVLATVKAQGMFAYLKDVHTLTVYTGAAWSTVGPVDGALLTWTPTVTQGVAVTVTVNEATYRRTGRWIEATAVLTATSAGTASTAIVISLPVASKSAYGIYSQLGTGLVATASNQELSGFAYWASTTTMRLGSITALGSATTYIGTSGWGTIVNTTVLSLSLRYEAGADN